MSKPNNNHDNPALGVFLELASASSALRMEPKPIPPEKVQGPFLCERDEWAKHCVDHIHAAAQNLLNLQDELRKIHSLVFKANNGSPESLEALQIIEKLI